MSIYTVATLGEDDNLVSFNDYTIDPVYRTQARSPSKWQIRQQDLPVPFESGSSDFLTLIGDSAYILTGVMYPSSELSYDAGLAKLRAVCSLDLNQDDIASDQGYVPYKYGDASGNLDKQIFMKPLYVQLAETTQQGFVQPFTIYAKIKDPTIFSGVTKTASTLESNTSMTTGSAVFPVTFPVVFGSTLFTVSATAQNNGNIAGYPASIIVTGPVNNPKITNQATGESIEVDVNLASTSDILTLIYDKDTLDINVNGTSKVASLTNDSTLFKIQPGANTITLSGTTVSDSAFATINYYDTWPLA